MSSVAEAPRARAGVRPKPKKATRAPFAGSILWIAVLGALLAGIVAVNVVVLQLNVQLDQLGRERAQLKADIATTRSQLSSASANSRIEGEAASKLGLVPAEPALTTYVRLTGDGR